MRFYEFAEVSTQGSDQLAQPSQAAPNTSTPSMANAPAAPTTNVNLTYNIEFNEQVKVMQAKLAQIGYDVGPPGADGKYGPWTAAAVQAFKKDYQLGNNANSFSSQDMMKLDGVINGTVARVSTPTKPQLSVDTTKTGTELAAGQSGKLIGNNVLAANPNPNALPKQNIIDALDAAAKEVGIVVQITPEGGRAGRESGTKNHPVGDAADFQIIRNNRVYRYHDDPAGFEQMIRVLTRNARGRTNVGIGRYNWGVHYDESGWRQVAGNPPVTTWS